MIGHGHAEPQADPRPRAYARSGARRHACRGLRIATYVTMQSAYVSLYETQLDYYSEFRLADVFAHLKSAPESIGPTIAAIPGVDVVQTRVVIDVSLDVPGLAEPASGRLVSVPPSTDADTE